MMKTLKITTALFMLGILSGCAEFSALNQQVGDWAAQLNRQMNADKQTIKGSIESKRDIDTLYVRIKRQVGFTTRTEELSGTRDSSSRKLYDAELDNRGFIHEVNPGVYYQMADVFTNPKSPNNANSRFYAVVTLEKNGTGTKIYWKTRGSTEFAAEIKSDILTAIK
ncbi:hypothetical protein ACLS0F_01675 [Avibacterium endocarditidis]|uniref:hypothetical protein n=1 Tax=Avibacterium endocarditidis TaxID=380674 RepID=UPI0039F0024C